MAEAPSVSTAMRSTAETGTTLRSTNCTPPEPETGSKATRWPSMRTRVAVLRSAMEEPPWVELPATLPFSTPMLLPPMICGTALRSTSRTLLVTPVSSISLAVTICTGRALASSAAAGL